MTKIKLLLTVVLMLLACGMFAAPANAYIVLNDWAFNIDGAPSEYSWGDPFPATGSLDGSGLGTITVTVDGPGTHYVGLFVDHEIDEATNTYFNENGATSGTPAVGAMSSETSTTTFWTALWTTVMLFPQGLKTTSLWRLPGILISPTLDLEGMSMRTSCLPSALLPTAMNLCISRAHLRLFRFRALCCWLVLAADLSAC